MSKETTNQKAKPNICDLRVYALARQLEDGGITIATGLPESETYGLANDLRRSVSAVAQSIYEAHHRYSVTIKIDRLHAAIAEAEQTKKLLASYATAGYGPVEALEEQATGVIKQCWGLIKFFKSRLNEFQAKANAKASDELVSARA